MSLVERISQALNDTSPQPWTEDGGNVYCAGAVPVAYVDMTFGGDDNQRADARLIAAAPGLLAECAQRLTPNRDPRALVAGLRALAEAPHYSFAARDLAGDAADLLEQVFLDPQETNQ